MTLRRHRPQQNEKLEWIKANATKFTVSAFGRSEPDHPLIAVFYEVVDQPGKFTREEAEQRVAELESSGRSAWLMPTRAEFQRLIDEWEARHG